MIRVKKVLVGAVVFGSIISLTANYVQAAMIPNRAVLATEAQSMYITRAPGGGGAHRIPNQSQFKSTSRVGFMHPGLLHPQYYIVDGVFKDGAWSYSYASYGRGKLPIMGIERAYNYKTHQQLIQVGIAQPSVLNDLIHAVGGNTRTSVVATHRKP